MEKENLVQLIEKISTERKLVLVFGDVMIDHYEYGVCKRKNPEVPAVPLIDFEEEEFRLGGAANTAHNIKSLGGEPYLLGVVGKDELASCFFHLLAAKEIGHSIVQDSSRKTTCKRRTYVRSENSDQPQYISRNDKESKEEVGKNVEGVILRAIDSLENIDAIVISDYAKGMLTNLLYHSLLKKSQSLKIPFVIDPRPVHTGIYREATLITPNTEEAREMAQHLTGMIHNGDIPKIGNLLRERLQSNILLTRGSEGMSLFDETQKDIPTMAREVFDVTGAGDTVVAGIAVALAHRYSLKEAAYFANYAAGIAVEKPGTYAVSLDDLKKFVKA